MQALEAHLRQLPWGGWIAREKLAFMIGEGEVQGSTTGLVGENAVQVVVARQLYERADGLACGHAMPDVIGSQQTQHRQQMLTQVAAGNGGLGHSYRPWQTVWPLPGTRTCTRCDRGVAPRFVSQRGAGGAAVLFP